MVLIWSPKDSNVQVKEHLCNNMCFDLTLHCLYVGLYVMNDYINNLVQVN